MTSRITDNGHAQQAPDFCIERNSVIKTKLLIRIWERSKTGPVQLLDVGCGDAAWLVPLLENVENVVYHGVEPQKRLTQQAQANLPRFAGNIRVAGGEDIKSEFGKRFDIVISRAALEHVYRRTAFLDQMCEAVAPGGSLLFTIGTNHFKQDLRTDIRNVCSQILARVGLQRYYTSPVDDNVVLAALERNGLHLEARGHYSLTDLKMAHKLIDDPTASRDILIRWLMLEEQLNHENSAPERLSALTNEVYFDALRSE